MSDPEVHVIVSDYPGFGASLTSPQVPGLIVDAPQPFTREAVVELLHEVGAVAPPYQLVLHIQEYQLREGREWFVRYELGDELRLRTSRTLESLLDDTPRPVDQATKSATGEATFMAVLPSDTAGWVSAQMFPGDAMTVAMMADGGVALLNVHYADEGEPGTLDPSMTMRELFDSVPRKVRQTADFDMSGEPNLRLDSEAQQTYVSV